jgi:hypothetical protein
VSRSAANNELQTLVRHGVLNIRGRGATTTYAFGGSTGSSAAPTRAGRRTAWTENAIERELRVWLDGRSAWPSYSEFVKAAERDLYAAASRNGGVGRWRRILGL